MPITKEELSMLKPGDVVKIISRDEADKGLEEYQYSKYRIDHAFSCWAYHMSDYCGEELTVRLVSDGCIYVVESGFFWLPEYIDSIVWCDRQMEQYSLDDITNLLFGGRDKL